MRFFRRRARRRSRTAPLPIGEAEAYARLHGERGEEIVRVEPMPPPPPPEPPQAGLTGESLRRAFERRLQSRGGRST
jgi:hypothetical protein